VLTNSNMSSPIRLLLAFAAIAAAGCSSTTNADPIADASPDVATTTAPAESTEPADPTASGNTSGTGDGAEATTEPSVASQPPLPDTEPVTPVRLTPPGEERFVSAMDDPLQPVGTTSGEATKRAQWRLLELGFWLQDPNGDYGTTTTQAVIAFQKYYGLETDGVLGPITAEALSNTTDPPRGRSTTGTLVEIDKSKQLVFLVNGGFTSWVLNTSTGSEQPYTEVDQNSGGTTSGDSVTRTGMFKVNREHDEGWWEGDLGEIYRPKYFDGGIALHGSYNVPDYPASHGCVRLSIPAMDWIWEEGIIPKGTPVWVHGEIPNDDDA
jgi:hypothetical protein